DFVAHMNPLGVLRARDAMVAAPRPAPASLTLPADTPLRDAMARLAEGQGRVLLTDNHHVIGMLTEGSAVAALIAKRGAEGQEARETA
ncbi:MAG: CBS domain-containing protein, partial [Rhodobacteraceae bacterium]|nr:CBS domain-containing protein [Paracoccaceae bacterium]